MTGLDTTTAVLAGRWSVDNFGLDILVNGISLGVTNPGFNTWSAFSVSSALLLSGMNTIDFVARDVGGIAGFRAEFTSASASASVPDAASTLALLGLTLSGLAAWNTRKSKLS